MHTPGATVILTRPDGKNQSLQQRFEQAGWSVVSLPALTLQRLAVTEPVPDPEAFDLIFFVSGFAVDCFFKALGRDGLHWPAQQRAACVGPGTARALQEHGVGADYIFAPSDSQRYDSRGLIASLQANDVLGSLRRVLIVCGTTGNPWFAEQLRGLSIDVMPLQLYTRHARQWDAWQRQQMRLLLADTGRKKYVVLTSPQGVGAFVANVVAADIDPGQVAESTIFVVTHVGQADCLRQAWPRDNHRNRPVELRIKQIPPQDDAIFHGVTISD